MERYISVKVTLSIDTTLLIDTSEIVSTKQIVFQPISAPFPSKFNLKDEFIFMQWQLTLLLLTKMCFIKYLDYADLPVQLNSVYIS